MKRFKKFLANVKGSAFIESLMIYIVVAAIGVCVVGVVSKTIMDAAEGSAHVEDFNNNGGSTDPDEAFFNENGIWPGTYGSLVLNNDGTATFYGYPYTINTLTVVPSNNGYYEVQVNWTSVNSGNVENARYSVEGCAVTPEGCN